MRTYLLVPKIRSPTESSDFLRSEKKLRFLAMRKQIITVLHWAKII